MEALGNLVRSLAVVMILAAILEMFLPDRELKRFVGVIVGLFVLVTILNPLLSFLNQDLGAGLSAWDAEVQGESLDDLLAEGQQINKEAREKALENYRQKLAAQVAGLANLSPEVKVRDAKVDVADSDGVTGKLERIVLTLDQGTRSAGGSGSSGSSVMQPVVIDLENKQAAPTGAKANSSTTGSSAAFEQGKEKLRATLSGLYGISPEAVIFQEDKEGNRSVR